MKRMFLEKFLPASRTATIRKEICGIREHSRETLYDNTKPPFMFNQLSPSSMSLFKTNPNRDEREADGKPWYYDIKQYLKDREYLVGVSENDKRTLRRLASGFFLSGKVFYKRSVDMTLL
ncbi:hypothetical protein CR513_15192, partial [Mucuna pruriens]